MKQAANVLRREIYGYFASPVAYIFLIIFLMLAGYLTFVEGEFYEGRQASLLPFFYFHPILYLLFGPALSMRLWSEERKSGTIQLLLSLPITIFDAVLGKFLAAWIFVGVGLLLTFPMVLTVVYLGSPDYWAIFCGYLGSFLMAGVYLAIGSFTSALTKNQVVSFVIAILLSLVLFLAGFPNFTRQLESMLPLSAVNFVASFGFFTHFLSIMRGVIDLGDVFYYFSVMGLMLFANVLVLEARKAA